MIILCFAMFFGFIAIVSQSFFFTDFVADVVYNGDVTAPEDSQEYNDYTDGVKVGSLALGISAASSLVFSFIAGPVRKLLGMRMVLVFSYVIKTHGSESRGQEEASCMRVFWPTRPLQ